MAFAVRAALTCACICALTASLPAPSLDPGDEGMVVEDISEILREEGRYARCPPHKILIGTRCRQILGDEELRKLGLLEDYSDCVRKNVEDHGEGRNETKPALDLPQIRRYCVTMCMLRVEGL